MNCFGCSCSLIMDCVKGIFYFEKINFRIGIFFPIGVSTVLYVYMFFRSILSLIFKVLFWMRSKISATKDICKFEYSYFCPLQKWRNRYMVRDFRLLKRFVRLSTEININIFKNTRRIILIFLSIKRKSRFCFKSNNYFFCYHIVYALKNVFGLVTENKQTFQKGLDIYWKTF